MPGHRGTMKGRFMPKNPQKYVGNVNAIFFRSSWEVRFMKWLDENNAVLRWGSEELAIPYINPVKTDVNGRPVISRYYPDFIVMYQDTNGKILREIVEVKPHGETILKPGMNDREKSMYAVNQAKWKAAATFAEAQGAKFRVITEKTMFKNSTATRNSKRTL